MKAKHTVKILQNFTYTHKLGALVIDGVEVAPARDRVSEYKENNEYKFDTKKDAIGFCKFHGFDKAAYIGKK